jgi:putative PIN family toxin of toxin-antitoxin system
VAFPRKVVVDTNVLISAIITDGSCRQLLRLLVLNQKEIVVSDFILKELERFLRSKKFAHQERIPEILARIKSLTTLVSLPKKKLKRIRRLRDPKDQPVIQTALISEAELIITGDEDLLSLVKVDSIRIISVKEAVALLAAS